MKKTTLTVLGALALAGVAACAGGGDDPGAADDPGTADAMADDAMAEAASAGACGNAGGADAADAATMTTDSGLQYQVVREGDGPRPTMEDEVVVHYLGTFPDGTQFDTSCGGDPATFSMGGVIPGFTEALLLMQVGSHYRVTIPPELGYGEAGRMGIPPNATLNFEMELVGIVGM